MKNNDPFSFVSTNKNVKTNAYGTDGYVGVHRLRQQAQQQPMTPICDVPKKNTGLLGRLKEAVIELVTEEAELELPLGINQLTRKTFQASDHVKGQTFYRSGRSNLDFQVRQTLLGRR